MHHYHLCIFYTALLRIEKNYGKLNLSTMNTLTPHPQRTRPLLHKESPTFEQDVHNLHEKIKSDPDIQDEELFKLVNKIVHKKAMKGVNQFSTLNLLSPTALSKTILVDHPDDKCPLIINIMKTNQDPLTVPMTSAQLTSLVLKATPSQDELGLDILSALIEPIRVLEKGQFKNEHICNTLDKEDLFKILMHCHLHSQTGEYTYDSEPFIAEHQKSLLKLTPDQLFSILSVSSLDKVNHKGLTLGAWVMYNNKSLKLNLFPHQIEFLLDKCNPKTVEITEKANIAMFVAEYQKQEQLGVSAEKIYELCLKSDLHLKNSRGTTLAMMIACNNKDLKLNHAQILDIFQKSSLQDKNDDSITLSLLIATNNKTQNLHLSLDDFIDLMHNDNMSKKDIKVYSSIFYLFNYMDNPLSASDIKDRFYLLDDQEIIEKELTPYLDKSGIQKNDFEPVYEIFLLRKKTENTRVHSPLKIL